MAARCGDELVKSPGTLVMTVRETGPFQRSRWHREIWRGCCIPVERFPIRSISLFCFFAFGTSISVNFHPSSSSLGACFFSRFPYMPTIPCIMHVPLYPSKGKRSSKPLAKITCHEFRLTSLGPTQFVPILILFFSVYLILVLLFSCTARAPTSPKRLPRT